MANKQKEQGSWRDSARPARLWIFEAGTTFPLLLFFFHIKTWTFLLALLVMIFFAVLSHYGFTLKVFLTWMRAQIAGRRKQATPWWM